MNAAMNEGPQLLQLIDLRQLRSSDLNELFDEEAAHWLDELYWDYRPSLDLIKRFIDSRSLNGFAAFKGRKAAGYGFYVLEDYKALIGGLFASPRFSQVEVTHRLLAEMLSTLKNLPRITRVEAQLMPFGAALDSVFVDQHFKLYGRQFMLLDLAAAQADGRALSQGLRLDRWTDRSFESAARLIHLSYADEVDKAINDQYGSEAGGLRFLRNIVILPGCGQFLPEASFLVRPVHSDAPVGMVLTSAVAEGVGHTTQICVQPGYRGSGIGRYLMQASINALRARHFKSLSLTVTSANANAVRLYEKIGFRTIKKFAAGVWSG